MKVFASEDNTTSVANVYTKALTQPYRTKVSSITVEEIAMRYNPMTVDFISKETILSYGLCF